MSLTGPQMRALQALADLSDEPHGTAGIAWGYSTPKAVAKRLWPDSPGWGKVSSRRSNRVKTGAYGATMPMKAATLLWRLSARGCAECAFDSNKWTVTDRGRGVLAGTDEPLPLTVREPALVRTPKTPKPPRGTE